MSEAPKHTRLERFSPSSVRIGGLMLLILVVAVFITVLCVLCVQMAATEQARSDIHAQTTTETFEAESAANVWLSQVDAALATDSTPAALEAALPEGTKVDENTVSVVIIGNKIANELPDESFEGGSIADDGLGNRSSTSSVMLRVSVAFTGSGYTVTQWDKSRIYE